MNAIMNRTLNETDMKQLAARLGQLLSGGEVIELIGDVGSGKTTFTKGLAAGMGVDEDVQSPSFTISRVYDLPNGLRLAHYDFYRLNDAGIMADELNETLHDEQSVTVIEWAGLVGTVLPDDRLTIRFISPTDDTRELTFQAGGPKSQELLEKLA